MLKLTLNRAARVFSICGYSRGCRHCHTVNIVLRDRKRFENAFICKLLVKYISCTSTLIHKMNYLFSGKYHRQI